LKEKWRKRQSRKERVNIGKRGEEKKGRKGNGEDGRTGGPRRGKREVK
jgi:hypothetical protein